MVTNCIDSISIGNNLLFEDLYSLDFSDVDVQHGINRDQWFQLFALRRRLENITFDVPLYAAIYDTSGTCARDQYLSDSAAIICAKATEAEYFSLLLFGTDSLMSGEYEYRIDNGPRKVIYALRTIADLPLYTRWFIQKLQMSEADFFSLWERAFPLLLKSDGLTFRRFNGTYESLREEVIGHLGFLNDHFLKLWQQCNMDFPLFARKAKSEHGVDFSNESSKTRKSTKKMKQREATFSQKPVTCEIHTKLSPTINRIHIHPPKADIGGEKILIGIFVDHLNT